MSAYLDAIKEFATIKETNPTWGGISAEYVPIRHSLNLESVLTYEGTETVHKLLVGKELTGVSAF